MVHCYYQDSLRKLMIMEKDIRFPYMGLPDVFLYFYYYAGVFFVIGGRFFVIFSC